LLLKLRSLFIIIATAFLLFACAQPATPEGGPADKTGPKILKTFPEVGSVNVRSTKLVISFDEFIKKPAYDKEILISPFLKKRPKIGLNGKKLIIRFAEPLDLGVTYVVTLIDVQDYNAGNKMEQAFQLAFSTGATIDSMEVKGKIETVSGEGAKELTVLLFDADSVGPESLAGKRPAYLTQTDAGGNFSLAYLRPGPFKIFAIKDGNGSRSYTPPAEAIGLASDPLIVFDTSRVETTQLILSLPDQQAPLVSSLQWLTDSTLRVGFTEGVRADLLELSYADTNNLSSQPIKDWVALEEEIVLYTPRPRDSLRLLGINRLSDSLGNEADTSVLIGPRRARLPSENMLVAPELKKDGPYYEWIMPFLAPEGMDSLISLTDTSGAKVPFSLENNAFTSKLKPDTALWPGLEYELAIPGTWWGLKDSSLTYTLKGFDPEACGSLQGAVLLMDTSDYNGPYLIQLIGPETLTLTDTLFDLKRLLPGTYKARAILDADSNGVWTPGSLVPYRLPERIMQGKSVEVRANWVFEDYRITIGQTRPQMADTAAGPGLRKP
jgi:hypothetical protein